MKHDHKPTKKLKILLFASIMALPLLATGATCAIAAFNRNTIEDETENYKIIDTFYSSLEKTYDQPILSWVDNSPLKTPINNFTNVFAIPANNYINKTLIYWTSMTAIYIVFDIIIEAFTFITHAFNKEK